MRQQNKVHGTITSTILSLLPVMNTWDQLTFGDGHPICWWMVVVLPFAVLCCLALDELHPLPRYGPCRQEQELDLHLCQPLSQIQARLANVWQQCLRPCASEAREFSSVWCGLHGGHHRSNNVHGRAPSINNVCNAQPTHVSKLCDESVPDER